MKRLYSIIASTSLEVSIQDPDVLLERGPNVLTVTTDNIEGVVERLEALGVLVRAVHCITPQEAPPEEPYSRAVINDGRLAHR
jgi:hypothetical protein